MLRRNPRLVRCKYGRAAEGHEDLHKASGGPHRGNYHKGSRKRQLLQQHRALVATIKGVRYTVPINLKVSLYNHSPQVTQSYSSGTAVSATWRMRIRRDNPFRFDDTVYTYGDVFGSSFFTRFWGPNVESRYGEAWNKLPYDGAQYFWDLYGITLKTPTGQIGILGSVQSDRATCYKTVPCKFK